MSLLSKIFGATKLETPVIEAPKTHLAFVLLASERLPAEQALLTSFSKYSKEKHRLSINKEGDASASEDEKKNVMALRIEGVGSGFIGLMPRPVPNGEAEASFKFSVSSFSEENKLSDHSFHLIVTLGIAEGCKPLDSLMAFTSLLAAITEATESVGVYWGNAGATHTRDFFLSVASEHEITPRILLWNGISRAGEKGKKMSFLSYGMNQLGLPDLYLVCNASEGGTYIGRFFDLLAYIADRGEAIPAGDTIGATEDERILVEYVKSPADNKKAVLKIKF